MQIETLNNWPGEKAVAELLRCCGSPAWAKSVANQRPYQTIDELLDVASTTWSSLAPQDWIEAFAAHPPIGSSKPISSWSKNEQAGMVQADHRLLQRIARLNEDYYQKFGFVFLICATGKGAEEMLKELEVRFERTREQEIATAMIEQDKITKIRLEKLLCTD